MHILSLPPGHKETICQADPEILPILHERKLEAGQKLPEQILSIPTLPHGEKSGHGEQRSSIRFRKKASP